MLNKNEKCDIIYLGVRWDYMNDNILISTSMLNAFWEKDKKDVFDLLIPFVEYSIAITTKVDHSINVSKISKNMNETFGYDSMPDNVIVAILKRLTRNSSPILKRTNNSFILIKSLDDVIEKFDCNRLTYGERTEKVLNALAEYAKYNDGYKWDNDEASKALTNFFIDRGICVVRDIDELYLYRNKDDKKLYCVGQFILDSKEKEPLIFNYIEDMVKGFFVSTAISLQPQNNDIFRARFKKMTCFIDTAILLGILGLKTNEENDASRQLISTLRDNDCDICCFGHTLEEIKDIVKAYRRDRYNPNKVPDSHTLEAWDKSNVKDDEINHFLFMLETTLEFRHNIKIVYDYSIEPSNSKSSKFNKEDFRDFINSKISYINPTRLDNDVNSIEYVLRKRGFISAEKIENCRCLFITSNTRLANITKTYFESKSSDFGNDVCPIISDIDMSSIIWLKSYSTQKSFPKIKLIENALCAVKPTTELMERFYEHIELVYQNGGITKEEAFMMRVEPFCIKQMTNAVRGDKSKVNEDVVLETRQLLEDTYSNNAGKQIDEITQKYNASLDRKEQHYKNLLDEKERAAQEDKERRLDIAVTKIKTVGEKAYHSVYRILLAVSAIFIIVLIILFLIASILMIVGSDLKYIWAAFITGIVGFWGGFDLLLSKRKVIVNMCHKLAKRRSDVLQDRKRKEYDGFV